jgi:polyisoprenoid-binding protein YceI
MSWKIDPAHTRVVFSVRHMMISQVHGGFDEVSGTVEFDEEHPTNSTVDVKIKADSINTGQPQRDTDLKAPNFLDVEKYPYLCFKSQRVEVIDDRHGKLIGDLTIKDVSKEVTLDVEYAGQVKSPFGHVSAGFTASTMIDRKDWGLTWNKPLETGGVLIGDELEINIEVELIKETEEEAEAVPA